MGLDKVIVRAILTTLASIGILLVFIIVGLCAIFPSTSMELAYDMGMENSCIHFAERAYKESNDVYYIAYATEVAIEEDKTGKIISCGEKFINDDDFETYCDSKREGYEQFIYGNICVSKYEKGDKEGALALAFESLHDTFPEGNAMVAVLFTSLGAHDTATVEAIKIKLNALCVEGADGEYLQKILAMING